MNSPAYSLTLNQLKPNSRNGYKWGYSFMNFKQPRSGIKVAIKNGAHSFIFIFRWNSYCGKWGCKEKKSSKCALLLLGQSTNHQRIQQWSASEARQQQWINHNGLYVVMLICYQEVMHCIWPKHIAKLARVATSTPKSSIEWVRIFVF